MPAINLLINEKPISYEIRNNIIILKENNDIVYEFPIPKGYYLIGTTDYEYSNDVMEKCFIIAKNKLNSPLYIPEGFDNLKVSRSGVWYMEEVSNPKKKLYYIDTSVLTLDDFKFAFYGNVRAKYLFENEFKIPESFWYDCRYHFDYLGARLITIKDIPHYMQDYDVRARLIKEDECMALIALNRSSRLLEEGMAPNLFNVGNGQFFASLKYAIRTSGHLVDNWRLIASSIENPNVYRFLWPALVKANYLNYTVDVPFTSQEALTLFPVIDENSHQKTLKYSSKNS